MTVGVETGADLFVAALERYGVEYVFGNPGTTELPVLDALGDSDIEYVLGLHEDAAVGTAAGYAQARRHHGADRPLGVVNLHVTPGLAHGLGNLYGAAYAGAPLLVTAGNHELDFRHEEPLLTGDLEAMARQFCKDAREVTDVEALPMVLRRAVRTALTPPTGPVFLALPVDVMQAETEASVERLGPIPDAGAGDPEAIERAAQQLIEADQPVLVVGDHVARAGEEAVESVVDLAEATGARVHGEILACEVNFPLDHDQWLSFVGPDEDVASMLMSTDTIAFVGCSTNTTLLRHEAPLVGDDTTTVHVSPDPWQVGKTRPADAAVVGDPGRVCAQLADRVRDGLDEETRAERLAYVDALSASLAGTMREMGEDETPAGDDRASKADLVDAMTAVCPDAFVVDEGVTARYALLTRFPLQVGQYVSNKGGGLGYGVSAAVGVALAESDREDPHEVVAYVGDGSYLYYPQAIYTAARYGLDLTVVVVDNRNYRILRENAATLLGGEAGEHDLPGMDVDPAVDIPTSAESYGARGTLVETADAIEGAMEDALEREGADVLDVLVHD